MTTDEFWAIIDAAKASSRGAAWRMIRDIGTALGDLDRDGLVEYQREFDARMDESYTWNLWGAAYLINNGCSDDGFMDFRALLIANGRAIFEAAVRDPDSLAGVRLKFRGDGQAGFEEFLYVAAKVWEGRFSGAEIPRELKAESSPSGDAWTEGDLPKRLPRLAKKAKASRESCGLVPGQVFRIPIWPRPTTDFAYFMVVGIDRTSDGDYGVLQLFDYPPPNADIPADWRSVPTIDVRRDMYYEMNNRLRYLRAYEWRKSTVKALELLDVVPITPFDPTNVLIAWYAWDELEEVALAAFEPGALPTFGEGKALVDGITTEELEDPSEDIIARIRVAERWLEPAFQRAFAMFQPGADLKRTLAYARLARRARPDSFRPALLVGAILCASEQPEAAELEWARCLDLTPPVKRKDIEELITLLRTKDPYLFSLQTLAKQCARW